MFDDHSRYHGRQSEGGTHPEGYSIKTLYKQLQTNHEDIQRVLEKIESTKDLHQEIQYLNVALQEEKFRSERLEEQINDLTELHQNEVENLKQAMADMEEKVQYQSEERLRDIHEMLEHCQTKVRQNTKASILSLNVYYDYLHNVSATKKNNVF